MATTDDITSSSTTSSPADATPASTPHEAELFEEAFKRCEAEIRAVDSKSLVQINVDVLTTVGIALNAAPKLARFREEMRALPGFEVSLVDKLADYAGALAHAQAVWVGAAAPSETLAEIYQEASALRETLVSDARALARHGLIHSSRLDDLSGASGYRNVASDLLAIAAIFSERWSEVASQTAVKPATLDRAKRLAQRMTVLYGAQKTSPPKVAEAGETRARAFTLFVEAYENARRAMTFIRWFERDADDFVPSIYGGRKSRRRDEEQEPSTPQGDASPQSESVTSASSPVAPAAPSTNTSPDRPGASPFVS